MRVFYAITFSKESKKELATYIDIIKRNSIKGRFTNEDNLHLTLEFIGEVKEKNLNLLINILHKLSCVPHKLNISCMDSFKRKNKEIVWIGIERNDKLIKSHEELKTLLSNHGFNVENRPYKPHITLGREVVKNCSLEELFNKSLEIPVKSIAIMESKRVNGKLIYEPLEEIIL